MVKHRFIGYNFAVVTPQLNSDNIPIPISRILVTTIFICHNEQIVHECLAKYDEHVYIMLVGSAGYVDHPRVIIARNLPDNIEHEPKLLTFTAWYAIIKNNLFPNSEYLCLLEYDTILSDTFFNDLAEACANNTDIVSFMGGTACFMCDIKLAVMSHFLHEKKISYVLDSYWYYTTNHCMKRHVLEQFVGWYYPDYTIIKEQDLKKLSWYHERLFSVFLKAYGLSVMQIAGLRHFQSNSHRDINQR